MEGSVNIVQFVRLSGVLPASLVLAMVWLLVSVIGRTTDRLGSRFAERRLLIQQVSTVLRFAVSIAGITAAILFMFKLSEQMLLALGGTIAVAVGIAMKDLAASVLAGLMILFDRPFQVGDRVSFGGFYGEIAKIGLRSVRLVTLDDNLVTIPNNKFLTDIVSSGNAGALDMLVQMDFHIGVDQDVAAGKRVVRDALTTCRYAYLDKPWAVMVSQEVLNNALAVRLRAKVYVLDVKYEKALVSDVTERVLIGLREAGVAPPAILHREQPGPGGA
ncbi:MAG: mechanosensitive ion channel [Myxococcales bacterium]|nr:mechanosensitive ion channel [Myxococcales bacterium]MCB9523669.1 mechanosensitive ion channel [Myxococcales bacterium]